MLKGHYFNLNVYYLFVIQCFADDMFLPVLIDL